jgi:hypothetical protein
LKEAFVATLLELARTHDGDDEDEESVSHGDEDEDDPLEKYEFWRTFKAQVKILRNEMGDDAGDGGGEPDPQPRVFDEGTSAVGDGSMTPMFQKMRLQGSSHEAASPQSAAGADPRRQPASSARSPINAFAPLAENRSAGLCDWGV